MRRFELANGEHILVVKNNEVLKPSNIDELFSNVTCTIHKYSSDISESMLYDDIANVTGSTIVKELNI